MAIELAQISKTPENAEGKFAKQRKSGFKITSAQRMFLLEQLALMLETGNSLHQALSSLAEHSVDKSLQKLVATLAEDVASGRPFSAALAKHPQSFSNTHVSLIAASENGGFMHEVLTELLQMEEKSEELRSTVFSALSYPAFLVVFSIAVVVFVLAVVFPKFATMFDSIRDQLPSTTLFLMHCSDLLRFHWPQILVGISAVVATLVLWSKTEAGRSWIDSAKLSMPGVRTVCIQIYLVQLLRVISLSLGNGVRIVETLEACRDVVSNTKIRSFILGLENDVQQGSGIARGFMHSSIMPPLVKQMITTGEESGELARVCGRVANYYEKELGKKLTALSKMAEPIMLMVMGLIVGILVSSLILPIFKLSRAVG